LDDIGGYYTEERGWTAMKVTDKFSSNLETIKIEN